jgi:hypothetical protein
MSDEPVLSGAFPVAGQARRVGPLPAFVGSIAVIRLPARRVLQLALGLIWLLDAALQYQPFMFSRSFVTGIIEPTASGNPGVVAHPLTWAAHLMLHHLVWYNAAFATIQLVIALGILYRPTVRLALAASIVWALFVWWFGEGLGGVLAGNTPVMGAPGAVVLYAVIALLVWPGGDGSSLLSTPSVFGAGEGGRQPTAFGGLIGRSGALLVWLALWGSFAWFLLQPANRSPSAIGSAVGGMASGQPGWIRGMETGLGRTMAHHGTEVSIVLAVLCGLLALGVWSRHTLPLAVVVAVQLGVAFWVTEAFGGIFTGSGTDPNSGLPLVLLACCYWPVRTATSAPGHLRRLKRSAGAA